MTEAIRVLIVDDHAVVRQGLRAFLQLQPDLRIVGEAADSDSAVGAAKKLAPNVVLLDLLLPGARGASLVTALRAAAPKARVLVLSSYADEAQVFAVMQAGARGYLLKDVQPEALADAIRQVHQGLSVLHPDVARRLSAPAPPIPGVDFTERERDVLKLMAQGFANKEIAQRLFIAEATVKTHVSNILQKLGVADRTQAALYAVRNRLVE
jgi:NarL family two-component system response regulator LiaR